MFIDTQKVFDTSDTKPRIHAVVALLLAATAIDTAILLLSSRNAAPVPSGGESALLLAAAVALTLIFVAVVAVLARLFVGQLRYNPYSYNTIYYAGFALFFLTMAISHGSTAAFAIMNPGQLNALTLFGDFLSSAKTFMLVSAPFVLGFSVALCVSNVALIRHEGLRFVNVLGILLAFAMVASEVALYRVDFYVSGSTEEVFLHDLLTNLFAAAYLYVECMIIGSMVANALVSRHDPPKDRDYLVILGCGIRKDGTPTPLLAGRCDRALEFDRAQREQGGPALTFVASGGQGPDEVVPESASMKAYLVENGVEPERIIEEDRSTSTFENMRFSKEKIREHAGEGATPKVAFSTTNYHVFRGGLFARRVKMRAQGMGARTKWWFWPNAAVREFVGILSEHRGKQAAILGAMVVVYTVMTFFMFG